MKRDFRKPICAVAILVAAFTSTAGTANWEPVIDLDLTDVWSNPGYPSNQSPATVGAYLQDLLNLPDAPVLRRQNTYHGGVVSGLGNPTTPDALLLALHFGNGNDNWAHDGPFDVFFSCLSDCDSFTSQNTNGNGNYRLYSTGANQNPPCCEITPLAIDVTEPASFALVGLGLAALGFVATRRRQQ